MQISKSQNPSDLDEIYVLP